MTKNFEELKELLKKAEGKREDVEAQIDDFEEQIKEATEKYQAAELCGTEEEVTKLKEEIDRLQGKLRTAKERLKFYNLPPQDRINMLIKISPDINEAAQRTCQENTETIIGLQDAYDEAEAAMKELKLKYLEKVAEMGKLYRKSKELAEENTESKSIMRGQIPTGTLFRPINTDVYNDPLHVSEIFVNPAQTQRAFNGEEYLSIRKERTI